MCSSPWKYAFLSEGVGRCQYVLNLKCVYVARQNLMASIDLCQKSTPFIGKLATVLEEDHFKYEDDPKT